MKVSRLFITVGLIFVATASLVSARSILERKMFYLTTENKSGEAKYWTVFLGNYDCSLTRKFPGEPEQIIKASLNISLLSSGYIDGNGISEKGKIESLPIMLIKTSAGEDTLGLDSIDCLFDYGQKVRTTSGKIGDFVINLEGQKLIGRRFNLTEYKMVDSYGEKILKGGNAEIKIQAIAFSKDGIQRALKAADAPAPAPVAEPAK